MQILFAKPLAYKTWYNFLSREGNPQRFIREVRIVFEERQRNGCSYE